VDDDAFEVFDEMHQWDRSSVQVEIGETTFRKWMHDTQSSGILSICNSFTCENNACGVLTLFKLFFFLSMLVILHVFNPIQFSGYKQSM
jgi:8-amino-7-oxononanoate synthase